MATFWDRAVSNRKLAVKKMQKFIPFYDYSDKQMALVTNDKFCKLFLERLKSLNSMLFNIVNTSYELGMEGNEELNAFQRMRDEMDIFIDEIKVMHVEWNKNMPQKWLEKLIEHDLSLIKDTDGLSESLEDILENITSDKESNKEFWEKVAKDAFNAEEQIDGIVRMFMERDAICNLKPLSFEKVFKAAQKEISEKI